MPEWVLLKAARVGRDSNPGMTVPIPSAMHDLGGKSYEERLQMLNMWTLEERRNKQDLTEVFLDLQRIY